MTLEQTFMRECLKIRGVHLNENVLYSLKTNKNRIRNIPYFNQISQLGLGQMTVYKLQIQCSCQQINKGEQCVQFLKNNQSWPSFLGPLGDGIYKIRNQEY